TTKTAPPRPADAASSSRRTAATTASRSAAGHSPWSGRGAGRLLAGAGSMLIGAVGQRCLDQCGGHPFQDVERLGAVKAGDVGEREDRVDAQNQVHPGPQAVPGGLVKAVARRGENVVDPPAAPAGALVAGLGVERQPQRRTQTLLVVEGVLA